MVGSQNQNSPKPVVHRNAETIPTKVSLPYETQHGGKFLMKNLGATKSRWLKILRPQGNPYGFDTKSEPQNLMVHQITRP